MAEAVSASPLASPIISPRPQTQSPANRDPALTPQLLSPTHPAALPRPLSHASVSRLSQYSTTSNPSKSRPVSHVMSSIYPSSLSYTLVRDFAYPPSQPLHYGPPPEPSGPPSGMTTPASEPRRLSDPPVSWEQKMPWDSWTSDGFNRGHDIPPISFGDGPPYSEDEDLQSPVVSTRHKKHKSTSATLTKTTYGMSASNYDEERGHYVGTAGDGSERYYVNNGGEANGPGGEYVTYPPGEARHSRAYHYAQRPQQEQEGTGYDSSPLSSPGFQDEDQSRYSRDYQFTITSPDEEFHGKAVALFDFERENENELPLVEGQIIWVSYRHGQGWLVAEDPKTQESGLVPEEYVRLLRDIEGGMSSLAGHLGDGIVSPDVSTPTQTEPSSNAHATAPGNAQNGYHQPVVSMFSTSSKDLNPYPTEQLGIQTGQVPPQVIHYHGQRGGSQANTPTLTHWQDGTLARRGSEDADGKVDTEVTIGQNKQGSDANTSITAAR